MSCRRIGCLLRRYSPSPFRYTRRVITTSLYSTGILPSELSRYIDTSAIPSRALDVEPEKMTSSDFLPLSNLMLCSPNTQRMASATLDLPEPFGPTIEAIPLSKRRVVGLAKDLKPASSSLVRCILGNTEKK